MSTAEATTMLNASLADAAANCVSKREAMAAYPRANGVRNTLVISNTAFVNAAQTINVAGAQRRHCKIASRLRTIRP